MTNSENPGPHRRPRKTYSTPEALNATVSSEVAGAIVGLSGVRILQLEKEGYFARATARGGYRIIDVVQGALAAARAERKTMSAGTTENRLREAKAKEVELRTAIAAGDLVDWDEARSTLLEEIQELRSLIAGIPASFTRDLGERRRLEGMIDEVFERSASRALARNGDPAPLGHDLSAAAEGSGRPMGRA